MDENVNNEPINVEDIQILKVDNKEDIKTEDLGDQSDLFTGLQNMSFNRKFRRMLLKQSGYIKHKNKLGFNDWVENLKNNIRNGKQLHALNTEQNIKSSQDFIDKVNESTANFLVQKGHSEERVAEIIKNNMDTQERIQLKKIKK